MRMNLLALWHASDRHLKYPSLPTHTHIHAYVFLDHTSLNWPPELDLSINVINSNVGPKVSVIRPGIRLLWCGSLCKDWYEPHAVRRAVDVLNAIDTWLQPRPIYSRALSNMKHYIIQTAPDMPRRPGSIAPHVAPTCITSTPSTDAPFQCLSLFHLFNVKGGDI